MPLILPGCAAAGDPAPKHGPTLVDPLPWQGPDKTAQGETRYTRPGVRVIFPADAPCTKRAKALTSLVARELVRIKDRIGLQQIPVPGITVIFHGDNTEGASKTKAFARWDDQDQISANFYCDETFNETTPLLQGLIPNELVKALMLATVRSGGRVKRDSFPDALAWIMEGMGTTLHQGGWFGVPPSDWAAWFLKADLLPPIADILHQDYRHAWQFNRYRTHTFNIIEFPALGSFIEYLAQHKGADAPLELLRLIGSDPIEATFTKVFDEPLASLDQKWRKWLKTRPAFTRAGAAKASAHGPSTQETSTPDPAEKAQGRAAPDLALLAEVIHAYATALEASARALTIDSTSMGPWAAKYGQLLSVMPILNLELDRAHANLIKATSLLKLELSTKARTAASRLGLRLLPPFDTEHLVGRGVKVLEVLAGKPGAAFGLQPGDELHLLDGDFGAWLDSTAPAPHRIVVTRDRKDVVLEQ